MEFCNYKKLLFLILLIESYLSFYAGQYNGYIFSLSLLVGHMFSIFNKLSGGKGVATSFGFILALNHIIGVIIILIWLLIFLIKRVSGLSAIISFISLPIVIYFMSDSFMFFLISILHSIVILINHRNNIREYLQS